MIISSLFGVHESFQGVLHQGVLGAAPPAPPPPSGLGGGGV